jgi:hypothetical protein
MKTILLTTVLILSSFAAKAQVFVTIDPIYLHAGILCNNHSIEKIGFMVGLNMVTLELMISILRALR